MHWPSHPVLPLESQQQTCPVLAVQAKQLLGTQQFHQSQLKEALVETYLGLDEVMAQEETREQLRELAGGSSEKGADGE